VTFEALLTFFGILVAVLAVARPVQRLSLRLFVPLWGFGGALLLALALIVCRDAPFGVRPPFGWSLDKVLFALTVGAFVIPVLAALLGWRSWDRARLTPRRISHVENVFRAALREREFEEVERIVRKNQESLEHLPESAVSVLFSRPMVAALVDSYSLVHLELLSNKEFLRSLKNRFGAVDVVVRELLRADVSPIRSAVVSRYGGLEHLSYSESERVLMEKTFQDPAWYCETRADYPLTMSALEALRTGKFDAEYNDIGRDYEAHQGISKRSNCPIYLAVKTHVIAIDAALEKGIEKDFYVSDLFDVFHAVLERSDPDETVWEDPRANREFPTPYAFLLYTITADLEHLSCTAVEVANRRSGLQHIKAPERVARDLAQNWSFCVWSIADSSQVSQNFRNDIIEQYLVFILKLGWEPSEIFLRATSSNVQELKVWRDLFLKELKERFLGRPSRRRAALEEAMESLDWGKGYVSRGSAWLREQLFDAS
jgi:hypothetical protein